MRRPAFIFFGYHRLLAGGGMTTECMRSSGEGTAHRRTPVIISLSFGEAAPIGEQDQNVGRTPAKPPFTGADKRKTKEKATSI